MPPTLVASSYGMNFKHMPELEWLFGYPFALALMLITAIIPFVWFRRKRRISQRSMPISLRSWSLIDKSSAIARRSLCQAV
jgi:hypothetical protein